jgi:ribosomal protein S18 acetylase RimI-like enzyme
MVAFLQTMTADRLAVYLSTSKDGYIEELLRAGNSAEEAKENADRNFEASFPDGVPAAGHELFDVNDDGETVGILWIARRGTDGAWWVYDIEIDEHYRRRGFGRATMQLAEARVRELGGTTLGLNVFAHNPNALALYKSLGFEPMAIQMRKLL